MKRGLALFLAALLAALALSACGGSGSAGSTPSATAASASGGEAMEYGENWDSAAMDMDWGLSAPMDPAEAPEAQPEDEAAAEDRLANAKMVYTADIQAESMDFDVCAAELEALVEQLGGYMEYAAVSSRGDGSRVGNYTIRVPSARFKGFMQSVGELSHVTGQSQSSENISERYYDTESRLRTQETKLERLQVLLSKAEDMEGIIALESAIAETELQIEQLTGSLRHYDALVDYATIELRLQEVLRLSTVEQAPPTFRSRLGNAFTGGLQSFGDFLQDLAIFLAYNWTWLAVLALIAAAAVITLKRRQRLRNAPFSNISLFKGKEAKRADDKSEKD